MRATHMPSSGKRPPARRVRHKTGGAASAPSASRARELRSFALTRSHDVVRYAVSRAPKRALQVLTSPSTSSVDVLLELAKAEVEALNDPLAEARLRGIQAQREMMERAGGLSDATEVGELLGISAAAVHKRLQLGQLLAIKHQGRKLGYPRAQFEGGDVVPGLPQVLGALRETAPEPFSQLFFLVSPNALLKGSSPLDALKRGHLQDVLRAARRYGEHGAD